MKKVYTYILKKKNTKKREIAVSPLQLCQLICNSTQCCSLPSGFNFRGATGAISLRPKPTNPTNRLCSWSFIILHTFLVFVLMHHSHLFFCNLFFVAGRLTEQFFENGTLCCYSVQRRIVGTLSLLVKSAFSTETVRERANATRLPSQVNPSVRDCKKIQNKMCQLNKGHVFWFANMEQVCIPIL